MAGALELKSPVLLGYPDESIEEQSVTDYWVSKIGGKPVSFSKSSILVLEIFCSSLIPRNFMSTASRNF